MPYNQNMPGSCSSSIAKNSPRKNVCELVFFDSYEMAVWPPLGIIFYIILVVLTVESVYFEFYKICCT